ncbi:MAG: efflux RND transporter periplasmic adaptor subunit [Deltaproteobacteria bacterium]|nr:efflux RND transporter periplasmic adaptor subunit [Deltaproteobacteria bacterium]
MKKFKILGLLAFVVIVAAVILVWFFNNRGEASRQEYKIATIKKGKILAMVSSNGTVNPLNTVKVGSQVSGYIQELLVDFNSRVKKDQVIARIDPAIYFAQVEQAKAQLLKARTQLAEKKRDIEAAKAGIQSAEAKIDSAKATLKQNKLQYERLANLMNRDTVAKSEFDAILAKRDNAEASLKVAQANLRTAKAQLARAIAQEKGIRALIAEREAALRLAEVRLKYCTIKSPIDGVVIYRAVDVGQTVAASLQSPVLFHIAEDLTRMQVEVDVSEADVGLVKPNQRVEFTVDAFPDKKFKATVRQVRNFATDIQNVVTYKVIANVNNDSLQLRPGMTANANIVVAEKKNVLKLPNAAFRFRPLGDIKEAKPEKEPPITERPFFKKTVEGLQMDAEQAKAYELIIKEAGAKLKGALAEAADDSDKKQAWITFFRQINNQLEKILREDQVRKLRAYTKYMANKRKREQKKGRAATVYVIDEDGSPKEMKIMVGVSNETETELVKGDLKEGDGVIVGLVFNSAKSGGSKTNPLLRMFGRR